jgi:hypothetical protein
VRTFEGEGSGGGERCSVGGDEVAEVGELRAVGRCFENVLGGGCVGGAGRTGAGEEVSGEGFLACCGGLFEVYVADCYFFVGFDVANDYKTLALTLMRK